LAQELNLANIRDEIGKKKDECDFMLSFRVNEEMRWKLRTLAARKHFISVAEMMRHVTQNFLEKEENKVL